MANDHYKGAIECIDAMLQTQGYEDTMAFCMCCAFKYLWRWKHKGGVGDIEKAKDYLGIWLKLNEEYKAQGNKEACIPADAWGVPGCLIAQVPRPTNNGSDEA